MISLLALAVLATAVGLAVAVLGRSRRAPVSGRQPVLTGAGTFVPVGRSAPARTSVLVDVERAQLVRRWAGLAVGLVTAAAMVGASSRWTGGDHGRSLLLVPAVIGLGVVAGVLGGDRHVRPPAPPQRSAGLERRRLRRYLPRPLTVVVALTTVLLGALLVMTTLLGSLDGATGRAGGTLSLECVVQGRVGSSAGPWLGRYYSLPLAVALSVALVVAAAGARVAVLRPRAGADAGDRSAVDADERLRRRSAEALVAGCGVAVAATLLLAAPVTAVAMGNVAGASAHVGGRLLPSCAPAWWSTVQWSAAAAALLALVVLVWCVAVVLVPTRRHDVAAGQR